MKGALVDNPGRWNMYANMIFLEAPVGVGFSPSVPGLGLNDTQTANDNLAAIQAFYAKFPSLRKNKFAISGESYAGVYLPTLAAAILESNENAPADQIINFVAMEVGNGCSGTEVGACSPAGVGIRAAFLYGHNMVSPDLYANLTQNDCFAVANQGTPFCKALLEDYVKGAGPFNIYNVYAPCAEVLDGTYANPKLHPALADPLGLGLGLGEAGVECIDSRQAHKYLNDMLVKTAFHVDTSITWTICANIPYTPTAKNLPRDVYPGLISKIKVEIWEGLMDACVPGVLDWVSAMGYPVKSDWTPWLSNKQLAGYTIEYDANGFMYRSFLKSGHPIPEKSDMAALQAFKAFIDSW